MFHVHMKIFSCTSDEKLKTGVFDRSQIRKLIQDKEFVKAMNAIESSHLLKWYKNFWETIKRPTTSVLKYFEKLGTNVSIKLHYLFSHLDRFPQNLGDFSDEQVEQFHQGIKVMEERYQGRGASI